MRTIRLKSLQLINFKGVRSFDATFEGRNATISGANGTGKTTVFDAFLWLLFGKDSTGRGDGNFSIKTLDGAGKPILRLEHSVTALLDVDGKDVKLQRCYNERWTKPRGTTEETLTSHATEFYVNDVKMGTKREYDMVISAVISEDVFRMITNPYYFTSLKPDVQKGMILDMAGGISDDEVAAMNPEYEELLAQLSGKTLAQYAKEIAAKKKACKEALAVIPSQIEMAQRLMPEEEDWVALDADRAKLEQRCAGIDKQIADKSCIVEAENQRRIELQKQIGEKKIALAKRESEIRQEAGAETNKATIEINKLSGELNSKKTNLAYKNKELEIINLAIDTVEKKLTVMRAEFRKINDEKLVYPDGVFTCPTCKRPLDMEDIEAKQAEMQANFNASKAARLRDNRERGKAAAAEKEGYVQKRDNIILEISQMEEAIAGIEEAMEAKRRAMPQAPNVEQMIASDEVCIDLKNDVVELGNQLKMEAKPVDVSALEEERSNLNRGLRELNKRLAKREQVERIEKEIADLEEKRIQNNQALADLEKWEYTAVSFQKDKDAKLMERINGMFKYVSFSFVDEQLNGGENLTCVCTVNGTPYPDVNAAGKLNAGLDIINAICNAKGVTAPIFIDNRESVNEIIPTLSQVINLVVSREESLTINKY